MKKITSVKLFVLNSLGFHFFREVSPEDENLYNGYVKEYVYA